MIKRLLLLLFAVPSISYSAPSISNISGTISNGQSIVISGSGFGATGPDIKVFDDFESGTNGSYINSDTSGITSSATVGSWEPCVGCDIYRSTYSTDFAHGGTKSSRQNWTTNMQEGGRFLAETWTTPVTEVYLSYWVYLPSGMSTPDGGFSSPNWKMYWFYETPYPTNDYSTETIYDPPGGGLSFGCVNDCLSNRIVQDFTPFASWSNGQWQRMEIYLKAGATAGAIQEHFTNASYPRTQIVNMTGKTINAGTTGWDTFHIPGFARADTTTNTYYDDIYVATGDGARARVEIGNNSTYSSCTNLAVITPTSWGDTSITATVRTGSFTSGTAYLFVVDALGAVSSGTEITIGGGTSTITCYQDADNDLYGHGVSETVTTCSSGYYESSHFIALTGDCDDSTSTGYGINPGATDICGNSIDEDCSGSDATCVGGSHFGSGYGKLSHGGGRLDR